MSLPTTYVLGLGNVLMGDDGFGPTVVQAFLAEYVVGPSVDVVDLGTPGLDLAPWLVDVDHAILIDTVRSKAPAGTLRLYDKADVLRAGPSVRVGPHDPGVKEALLALELAGRAPRALTLIGVVPARSEMGVHLSAVVRAAVPRAVAAVVAALEQADEIVAPRVAPAVDVCWWTRP